VWCYSPFISVLSLIFYFECVVTHLFECVVTLITDRLDSPFVCKGLSSISVKLFFSVSAQPQLLEIESFRDMDIVSRTLLHLVFLFDLFFYFLSFLWLLYSYENWIELNYLSLPFHLNTKSQIGLYIFTLGFLQSYIILAFYTIFLGQTKWYQNRSSVLIDLFEVFFGPRWLIWCM
jgi:hypothetical protein